MKKLSVPKLMKKLFVPCTIALLAKKNGFNEPCIAHYVEYTEIKAQPDLVPVSQNGSNRPNGLWDWTTVKNDIDTTSAPLKQQLVDWFNDEFKIKFKFEPYSSEDDVELYLWHIVGWRYIGKYKNDNKALVAGFKEAFKLI